MSEFEGAVKPSSIEKAGFDEDIWATRITDIPTNMQMRAEYSSTDGLPDYVGFAPRGLSVASAEWLLQKFTYDANRQCTLRQIAYDSWNNKSTTAVYA